MNKIKRDIKELLIQGDIADMLEDSIFIHVLASLMIYIFVIFFGIIMLVPILLMSLVIDITPFIKFIKSKLFKVNITKLMLNYEKKLLTDKSYYLHNYKHTYESLNSFIYKLIKVSLKEHHTMYSNGNLQCYYGKRRSLGDIFLICKHYYPNCTLIEVFKILIDFLEGQRISGERCSTIKKYVFHNNSGIYYRKDNKTEYHKDLKFEDFVKYFNK